MMIATAALYVPGLLAIIHPRAAGFTLLAFCILIALLLWVWRPRPVVGERRLRWAMIAIPILFGLWANLHGGFPLGIVVLGAYALEALVRRDGALRLLAVTAAAAAATFANPYGLELWARAVRELREPALRTGILEWAAPFGSLADVFSGVFSAEELPDLLTALEERKEVDPDTRLVPGKTFWVCREAAWGDL